MSDLIELKEKTLIDLLLEEQQALDTTPVGRFADEAEAKGVAQHSDLIPLSAPGPGEQYAFQVNLDKCSGCKGCVTACHSLNGLDENETWRDVGLLVGENEVGPYQQTVTTACHHCVDPGCMNGCPVKAYEKDPVSGIVLHLDDQCIGCQYCVLKCPYDVPKYSSKRGIVRKCDMCHSRLSSGEAPACVQACPHEAIKIVTVSQEETLTRSEDAESFLPDCPDPEYTKPTTRYVSEKRIPSKMQAADAHVLRPQHAHWPLVGLLALSQVGIGGITALAAIWHRLEEGSALFALATSWGVLHLGLLCSVLHLGQPLKAWRIFLGFRHSWLSREAIVLGAASAAASAALGVSAAAYFELIPESLAFVSNLQQQVLAVTAAVGLVGVLTSVYIYVDTKRSFWRMPYTATKFYGSALLGGLAVLSLLPAAGGAIALGLAVLLKLGFEVWAKGENAQTRGILAKPLAGLWKGRLAVALVLAVAAIPISLSIPHWGAFAVLTFGVAVSELFERATYFRAVNAPKMPGGVNG